MTRTIKKRIRNRRDSSKPILKLLLRFAGLAFLLMILIGVICAAIVTVINFNDFIGENLNYLRYFGAMSDISNPILITLIIVCTVVFYGVVYFYILYKLNQLITCISMRIEGEEGGLPDENKDDSEEISELIRKTTRDMSYTINVPGIEGHIRDIIEAIRDSQSNLNLKSLFPEIANRAKNNTKAIEELKRSHAEDFDNIRGSLVDINEVLDKSFKKDTGEKPVSEGTVIETVEEGTDIDETLEGTTARLSFDDIDRSAIPGVSIESNNAIFDDWANILCNVIDSKVVSQYDLIQFIPLSFWNTPIDKSAVEYLQERIKTVLDIKIVVPTKDENLFRDYYMVKIAGGRAGIEEYEAKKVDSRSKVLVIIPALSRTDTGILVKGLLLKVARRQIVEGILNENSIIGALWDYIKLKDNFKIYDFQDSDRAYIDEYMKNLAASEEVE